MPLAEPKDGIRDGRSSISQEEGILRMVALESSKRSEISCRRSQAVSLAVILVLSGFSAFVLTAPQIPPVHASVPSYYVPITLTNSQSSATSSNLPVMLKVDMATYGSTYLKSNAGNIRFASNLSFTHHLYAWLENFTSLSNTHDIVWVNLGNNTIGASGGTLTMNLFRY
jgi:hypothetical protein